MTHDEALTWIQSNVSNYEIFIEMLPDTESVKAIVDAISGMVNVKYHFIVCMHTQ